MRLHTKAKTRTVSVRAAGDKEGYASFVGASVSWYYSEAVAVVKTTSGHSIAATHVSTAGLGRSASRGPARSSGRDEPAQFVQLLTSHLPPVCRAGHSGKYYGL